jgi:uncharacterized protein with PQ loop repeat
MKTKQQRKINSIFLYLLAIALALLVYSLLVMKVNTTGKVIQDMQNSYSLSQIQAHNNIGNCWITNNNKVYDITGLVDNNYFKENDCGKEISLSDYFQEVLNNRKVGILI